MQGDVVQRIAAVVRDAPKPVTSKQLEKSLRLPPGEFSSAVQSAITAGVAYPWPGRSPCFWHSSAETAARQAIVKVASEKALSKAALATAAAKLTPGFSGRKVEPYVAVLLSEKALQAVPAFSGASKLLISPGAKDVYFAAARAYIEQKVEKAGFDSAGLFTSNSSHIDAGTSILEAIRALEPVSGVPVSALRLRRQLPHLDKPVFDAAALQLREQQKVFLNLYADPHNVTDADRNILIDGQDGNFYVAIAIR